MSVPQNPPGNPRLGQVYVENNKIDIEVGELHCYLASDYEHYVTEVKGETPRILWMFGAYVPKEDWESGKIQPIQYANF